LKTAGPASGDARLRELFVEGSGETAYQAFGSLSAARGPNQDRVAMVRALRQWLEADELLAIVVGVPIVLSLLRVLGDYLIVTR
jgi:hypothetical protein